MEISEVWITTTEILPPNLIFHNNLRNTSNSLIDELAINKSIALSPYSISAAVMMLMLGAKGHTKSQLSSVIFRNSDPGDANFFYTALTGILPRSRKSLLIELANQVFLNKEYNINNNVKEKAKEYFRAAVHANDFCCNTRRSVNVINNWIAKKSRKTFRRMVSSKMINERTLAVFVNIVEFKGEWKTAFDPTKTIQQYFYPKNRRQQMMEMMQSVQRAKYGLLKASEILVLPFKVERFQMMVILPEDSESVSDFERMLSFDVIKYLNSSLVEQVIDVILPKLLMDNKLDLMTYFPRLGVTDIFNKTSADFSNLIREKTNRIYVSDATHEVIAKVSEGGESSEEGVKQNLDNPQHTFKANRPFLFYVIDGQNGVVMFMGRFLGDQ